MARKVIWSDEAIADLGAIVRYVAADNPPAAAALVKAILESTRALVDFPQSGRVMPEERDSAVREVIVEPYRVIYEVNPNGATIDVLRIWHGARGRPEL